MDIPLIEQAKIQAQVLVPLVKALQAELGEERANALVRKALGDQYRKFGEKWWKSQGTRDRVADTAAGAGEEDRGSANLHGAEPTSYHRSPC